MLMWPDSIAPDKKRVTMHDLLACLAFVGIFISPIIVASRVPIEDKDDCDLLPSPARRSRALPEQNAATRPRPGP